MKPELYVQHAGLEVSAKETETAVKADLKEKGIKVSTIASLNIYLKMENGTHAVYYVATLKDGSEVTGEL